MSGRDDHDTRTSHLSGTRRCALYFEFEREREETMHVLAWARRVGWVLALTRETRDAQSRTI